MADDAAPAKPPDLFPAWRYHAKAGLSMLVSNQAQVDALGPEWHDTPSPTEPVHTVAASMPPPPESSIRERPDWTFDDEPETKKEP